jgi:hypothetical protein
MKLISAPILFMIVALGVVSLLVAQSPDQQRRTREITSEEFRPPAKTPDSKPGTSAKVQVKRRVYHLAKRLPAPAKNNGAPSGPANNKEGSIADARSQDLVEEQIGITIWRLRPSIPEDDGPVINVVGDSGKPAAWTPVRVKGDHVFALGDLVRITVESPRDGVLYVVDREIYKDGSLGDAMLIFPTARTRSGDNRVSAGYLIDIPSWTDRIPYFMLSSARRADYTGELLTFIINSRPLPGIAIGSGPAAIPREQIGKWEDSWGTEVELFEMDGGAGEVKTKVEQEATRPHTRQLTQQEPVPQTIYRVKVARDRPMLINVSVRAKS